LKNRLEVIVNSQFTIDAGWWEEVEDNQNSGVYRIVHPPAIPMYTQVVEHLAGLDTEFDWKTSYCSLRKQAAALANLCLKWGSYFSVLTDRNKALYSKAKGEAYHITSHISDGEMARINIESSAALSYWLYLRQTDPDRYMVLVNRALKFLPLINKSVRGWPGIMAFQQFGQSIFEYPDKFEAIKLERPGLGMEIGQNPTRVFANILINYSWRNESGIEDIHAGQYGEYPLLRRRIRPSDERKMFHETAIRMEEGLFTMELLLNATGEWCEKISLFSMNPHLFPKGWTVTEEKHTFKLLGSEP
jgi:hypothetical protein